jgi:hypothetical protein
VAHHGEESPLGALAFLGFVARLQKLLLGGHLSREIADERDEDLALLGFGSRDRELRREDRSIGSLRVEPKASGACHFLHVRGQVFAAAGAKSGAEVLVNTGTAPTLGDPSVASLSDGEFV